MALAMYPKVLTVALRMAFLCAFRSSKSSKQILIHSLADTYSAPLIKQTNKLTKRLLLLCYQGALFVSAVLGMRSRASIMPNKVTDLHPLLEGYKVHVHIQF